MLCVTICDCSFRDHLVIITAALLGVIGETWLICVSDFSGRLQVQPERMNVVITSGGGVTTRAQSRSEGTIQRHTKQDEGTEYMNPQRHSKALHQQLQLSGAPRRGGKLSKKGICYKTSNSRRRTSHNLPAPPGVGQRHIVSFWWARLNHRGSRGGQEGQIRVKRGGGIEMLTKASCNSRNRSYTGVSRLMDRWANSNWLRGTVDWHLHARLQLGAGTLGPVVVSEGDVFGA